MEYHPTIDADLIVDFPPLWLGEFPDDIDDLIAKTHCKVIVNCTPEGHQLIEPQHRLTILQFPFYDIDESPNQRDIIDFLELVDQAIKNKASFWHCHAGLNRSGFMLAAFLHLHKHIPIRHAIQLLRDRRSSSILFNKTFENSLFSWFDH